MVDVDGFPVLHRPGFDRLVGIKIDEHSFVEVGVQPEGRNNEDATACHDELLHTAPFLMVVLLVDRLMRELAQVLDVAVHPSPALDDIAFQLPDRLVK